MICTQIVQDVYKDSVFLMRVANNLRALPGIEDAVLMVGSDANKTTLFLSGFETPEIDKARSTDLIMAVKTGDCEQAGPAFRQALDDLEGRNRPAASQAKVYQTLEMALEEHPNANLALISVPGQYAAAEAKRALQKGLHVFLFSDNVTVEEEVDLKRESTRRGLLVMGPDCGTSILDGVPLAFANAVRRGTIGIVGAAGTGIQEVTSLLDRAGLGISQAIGTGGRDLSEMVGGMTMEQGIDLLEKDPATEVIVLVSKPPAEMIAQRIVAHLEKETKPAVVCFLGYKAQESSPNVRFVSMLEETVPAVLELIEGRERMPAPSFWLSQDHLDEILEYERQRLNPMQHFVRGYYSGGTLCDEAQLIFKNTFGKVYSNVAITPDGGVKDPLKGEGNTVIDLGDDEFTRGRPHPMIDPALRNSLIAKEFDNPSTAVILLDIVLGYGSTLQPVDQLIETVTKARMQKQGHDLAVVCSLCGVDADPQDRQALAGRLAEAGIVVMPTNAQAARLAALIVDDRADLNSLIFGEAPSAKQPLVRGESRIMRGKPVIINIGVQDFYDDLVRNQAEAYHVDWKPVAGGKKELADILSKIL